MPIKTALGIPTNKRTIPTTTVTCAVLTHPMFASVEVNCAVVTWTFQRKPRGTHPSDCHRRFSSDTPDDPLVDNLRTYKGTTAWDIPRGPYHGTSLGAPLGYNSGDQPRGRLWKTISGDPLSGHFQGTNIRCTPRETKKEPPRGSPQGKHIGATGVPQKASNIGASAREYPGDPSRGNLQREQQWTITKEHLRGHSRGPPRESPEDT
jgi:hypothetical protein